MRSKTKVEFVAFSPHWEKYFEKEKARLKNLLKSNLIQAHHVGSTAITSIAAKPTLDILAIVHTLDGIDAFRNEFEKAGLNWSEEFGVENRRDFVRLAPDGQSHLSHIHIFEKNSPQIRNYLDFRDYLNAEIEVAKEYEKLKISLNEQTEDLPQLYTAGKIEFIKTVLTNIT